VGLFKSFFEETVDLLDFNKALTLRTKLSPLNSSNSLVNGSLNNPSHASKGLELVLPLLFSLYGSLFSLDGSLFSLYGSLFSLGNSLQLELQLLDCSKMNAVGSTGLNAKSPSNIGGVGEVILHGVLGVMGFGVLSLRNGNSLRLLLIPINQPLETLRDHWSIERELVSILVRNFEPERLHSSIQGPSLILFVVFKVLFAL